ncbi:MAG: hypothetical protein M1381_05640 [Deltaproteobacteria bacterium]|nr:hypothetical protein [Deltaproteobacteria bacterium]MCL5791801.1 hypothetical protein [Deltaproteobacteria bacterium]
MNSEDIKQLLDDGLAFYGVGKIEEAVDVWGKVIELDPGNQQAVDYINSAKEKDETKTINMDKKETEFTNIKYIRDLLKVQRFELAYDFLEHLINKDYSSNKQLLGYLSIAKAHLIKTYYDDLGGLKVVPRLNTNDQEIIKYNLDKEDGYIISLIDGYFDIEEIVQLIETIEQFDVMRRFHKLNKLGVIAI